jgi:hypothetical protein
MKVISYRLYGGLKLSYLLYDKSVYNDSQGKVVVTTNKDFNCFYMEHMLL